MNQRYKYDPERLPNVVCDEHPEWIELYNAAWKMAFDNIEYPGKDGWKAQLTCMPGYGAIWQWDSCFMTLFSRFSNGELPAMNNLDNLYRLQREDGFISMAYMTATDEPAYGERINPPLYAWVEWEYFLATGDDSRFEQILPVLVKYFDWVKENRRRVSGLYWFEDSGSSGMDNSPRSGYVSENLRGSDVCHIDLSCQQAMSARYLSLIAGYIGNSEISERFFAEYQGLADLINKYHWSSRNGFYYDLFSRSSAEARHNFINHETVAGFWPMLTGIVNSEQTDALVSALKDPECFNTLHPVPSLSKADPNYDEFGGYWRGSVWAPTNYMIVRGLIDSRRMGIAREIAIKHIDAMARVFQDSNYATIWECYSPDHYLPATRDEGMLVRPDFVGWSGLGPIAMLIEAVFGIKIDAPKRRISWEIATSGRHGVENLKIGDAVVNLVCEGRKLGFANTKITIETSGPIDADLTLLGREEIYKARLEPGVHCIDL